MATIGRGAAGAPLCARGPSNFFSRRFSDFDLDTGRLAVTPGQDPAASRTHLVEFTSTAHEMAPANDAAADTAVPAKAASADADAAALSARRDDAVVPSPWRDAPRAADACVPILGVAELWPELSRSVAAAKGKKAPAASSSTAAAAPNPMAALREQVMVRLFSMGP